MNTEPPYDDGDYYRALGLVGSRFASLELHVNATIWSFLGIHHHEAQILTAQLSFQKATDALESLILLRPTSAAVDEQGIKLLKAGRRLEQDRNRITHSVVVDDGQPLPLQTKITAKNGKGLVWHQTRYTVEKLLAIADDLQETSRALVSFMVARRKAIDATKRGPVARNILRVTAPKK